MLLTVPLLLEIAEHFTEAQIHLVAAGNKSVELIRRAPFLRHVHFADTTDKTPLGLLRIVRTYFSLRHEKFHVAFIGTNVSVYHAILARYLSNITSVVGNYPRYRWSYTHYRAQIRNEHRSITHQALLDRYKNDYTKVRSPTRSTVWIGASAHTEAQRLFSSLALDGKKTLGFLCRESSDGKNLPTAVMYDVVQQLADRSPAFLAVHILSPGVIFDEREWPQGRVVAVSISSLEVLAAFLALLDAFVAGDVGISHIADAVQTPTCVIAGPTRVCETGTAGAYLVKSDTAPPCMPCYGTALFGHCPHDFHCTRSIRADPIVEWYLNLPPSQ